MDQDSFDALLDNLQCPLCCLAMLPPSRSPMIIPECGHTICETCISKLKECPYCHHKISKPVKNILILQIIESLESQKLIPTFLNPPPPPENKLIPKIVPACTLSASGSNYIYQKFYHCLTCHISGDYGICEICARNCHKGHKIELYTESTTSYCDCSAKCKCKSLSQTTNLRCTFELTNGIPIEQPMYQCMDCNITGNFYLCQNCAIKCHHGHNLKFFDKIKGKHCRCLDQSICQISFRKPVCTFLFSGKNFIEQPWYYCKTCGLENGLGCCSVCAHHCHKGHQIEYRSSNESCYCDCGDGHCGNCKMIEFCNSSYLNNCTNLKVENKDKPMSQRMYNCATCGLSGICEGCVINCHINHSIEFVGVSEFCCGCKNTNNCIMMLAPLPHTNRSKCDRLDLEPDDVSACFTCYRCDKSGNKKICETCALKKHANHDIHLVGYLKFICSENEKSKLRPSLFKPKYSKV